MKFSLILTLLPVLFFSPLFASPRLPATVTWIGNSEGGGKVHVPQDIDALCVTPDGRVFSNTPWDEGGGNVTEFKDGKVLGNAGHTHGWGHTGGKAIACNAKYLFIGCRMENEGGGLKDPKTWPPKGKQWLGVSRRPLSDIRAAAPFDGGKGGSGDTLKGAFLVVAEVEDKSGIEDLPGMAADDKRLYVSCPADGTIKVFDAETMARITEWKIERPGPIALAKNGTLWVLREKTANDAAQVIHVDSKGEVMPGQFTFEPSAKPVNLAIAANGGLLLPDQGPLQQVRMVSRTGIGSTFAIGVKRGIFSNQSVEIETHREGRDDHGDVGPIYQTVVPGAVGDLRFNNPSALAVDAGGNFYVAQRGSTGGGSTVLESYDTKQKLRWRLLGLNFVDMADVDPEYDTQIFTKEERFSYDYTKTGAAAWKYENYLVNPSKQPDDPRLHIWSAGAWVRRISIEIKQAGDSVPTYATQRLFFVTDMNAEYLQVYDDSKPRSYPPESDLSPTVPLALFAKQHINKDGWPQNEPAKGEWIWQDKNKSGGFDANEFDSRETDAPSAQGWWVDDNGGVWLATEKQGLRYFPCQFKNQELGLGGWYKEFSGWNYATMQTFPHAAEFDEVKRVRYDVKTDVLYLGGTKGDDKNQHWKPMGPVIARYDGWLHGDKKLRWQIVAPYQKGSSGHESCEPMGFDVAGDYVFVPYTGAGKELKFSTGHIEVFRADNGQIVGHMEPGEDIGEIGLQDIRECLRAHQRKDGEYIVFLEDDYKAKIVMYRWKP